MAQIDGAPESDGGDSEIEAGGTVALVLEGPITDFSEAERPSVRNMRARANPYYATARLYSEADRGAMHVAMADDAVLLGPARAPGP